MNALWTKLKFVSPGIPTVGSSSKLIFHILLTDGTQAGSEVLVQMMDGEFPFFDWQIDFVEASN